MYKVYYRDSSYTKSWKRDSELRRNRKGLLTAYDVSFATIEEAQNRCQLLEKLVYETKIK